MSKIYKFAEADKPSGEAQMVGESLEEIRQAHGGKLNPGDVIDASRDPSAPLHKFFDWDDQSAAENYRKSQARRLIRRVEVVVNTVKQEPLVAPAFVQLRSEGSGYRSSEKVYTTPRLRESLIAQAKHDWSTYKTKYERITELSEALSTMDMALQGL
jgi:hypothetical protein